MALDAEEFKRRRQRREQQRQEKAEKAKKWRVVGMIGGSIVFIAGILALILSLRGCDSTPDATQTTAPPPDTTTIHLAAAGDLNITEKVAAVGED